LGFFDSVYSLPDGHHEFHGKRRVVRVVEKVSLFEVLFRKWSEGRCQDLGFCRMRQNTSSAGLAFFRSFSSVFSRSGGQPERPKGEMVRAVSVTDYNAVSNERG
jgi:hypothetical protein